jgi:hypothetical protein
MLSATNVQDAIEALDLNVDTNTVAINTINERLDTGFERKKAVIDYVDNTAVPPTEVDGDRYILDFTGASNAAWDGALAGDIVEFNGTSGLWEAQTPDEGMVAYVDAEDFDRLYVDDGVPNWEARNPSLTTRDDRVLVKSYSDLPAPISNVVTLNPGTLYEINGVITVPDADTIDFNGCAGFVGREPRFDIVQKTGTGVLAPLFQDTPGLGVFMEKVAFATDPTATTSKMFDCETGAVNGNIEIVNCFISGFTEIGQMHDYGTVCVRDTATRLNDDGWTLDSIVNVDWSNNLTGLTNTGTHLTLSGTLGNVGLHGGGFTIDGGETGLDVTSATITGYCYVKDIGATGAGTYSTGSFAGWSTDGSLGTPAGGGGDLLAANNLSDVASQQTSLNNVTAVAGATNEYVLTKDTGTGDATWKAVPSTPLSVVSIAVGDSPYSASNNEVILADCSGGSITVNLPAASAGAQIKFKKTDASANTLIMDGNGAETIDGNLTEDLVSQYESFALVSDGSNWFIF